MQLIGCAVLVTVCFLGTYAVPNYIEPQKADSNHNDVIGLLVAQMRSALIDTRALTPAESTCATTYNNRTQQINNLLTTQTNVCFENANRTLVANNQTANGTIANIRKNLQTVQQQLANCSAIADTSKFLNCTTASFDKNIQLLDEANSKAYQAEAQIAANQSLVIVVRQACVSAAIGAGKTNLTLAANAYQLCLSNISSQRMVGTSLELFN
uniref:Protein TsetseEP domain-containing protein n=1 Tax=Bactrocera latifrons TaxID=174628 RepID=A0A0K8WHC2_BACLA